MSNDDHSSRDDDSSESPQVASVVMTTAPRDRPRVDGERTTGRPDEHRAHDPKPQPPPPPDHPSMMKSLLFSAAIALVCGVVGAMGYEHFYGPKSATTDAKKSQSDSGSPKASNASQKSGAESTSEPGSKASTASSLSPHPAIPESNDLKEQIQSLDHRIDSLDENMTRLQSQLSLAIPLLRRIAPKE